MYDLPSSSNYPQVQLKDLYYMYNHKNCDKLSKIIGHLSDVVKKYNF